MARFRLARPAQHDLAGILSTSAERWGRQDRRRYAAVLAAAMRKIAADPEGPLTRSRDELSSDLRSFHIRHARIDSPQLNVGRPVHILYYRKIQPGLIEIIRVLHERMEPSRHIETVDDDKP